MLDESLEILNGPWSGEPFSFSGEHYQVGEMAFHPATFQRPRPPIWVVAAWPRPRSMARALCYDGFLPNFLEPDGSSSEATPERFAEIAAYVALITARRPFEIIVKGVTPADDAVAAAAKVQPFAEAGGIGGSSRRGRRRTSPRTCDGRIAAGTTTS